MSHIFPSQAFGRFRLRYGFTSKLLHDRYGFELGERYHRDLDYRINTTMEIDRAIHDVYRRIGVGFAEPFPRCTVEPFGHRFVPAMFGCECGFAEDAEPWGRARRLSKDEVDALPAWTAERFEQAEPVRLVLSQVEQLKARYADYRRPADDFCPHFRPMSAVQNLGSVINSAFSVQGDELLMDYLSEPELVHRLFDNIADLMLLCLDRFAKADGWPLRHVFLGNCTVSMLSPRQYAAFNYGPDHRIMEYARGIGAAFLIHQDSNVNPNLENYARFEHLQAFDVGQDTDFERLLRLCPTAEVNCILFPSWIASHTADELRGELGRLMQIGRRFPAFSFSLLDVDPQLDGDPLLAFHEVFRQCALEQSAA